MGKPHKTMFGDAIESSRGVKDQLKFIFLYMDSVLCVQQFQGFVSDPKL